EKWRSMNCTLVQVSDRQGDGLFLVGPEKSRHLRNHLKIGVGSRIVAGVLDGPLGWATVVGDDGVRLKITAPEGPVPPRPPVDLVLAMPRPKVMGRLWGALASIGIGHLYIIGAEEVEACYFSARTLEPQYRLPKLIEGLEQVRDTRLPEVTVEKSFRRFATGILPNLSPHGIRLLGHPGAAHSVREVLASPACREGRVMLAVGPEGGWREKELDVLSFHGFVPASLHSRALRTDTAVISLLALIYDALPGDRH
ncbi:MAG: RsmE family RNA methyltransferase, partial [Kiritimatiellae bacterium]|nr:RsmE family RNA methyltransferase [Kiritimatiellia bacterium]